MDDPSEARRKDAATLVSAILHTTQSPHNEVLPVVSDIIAEHIQRAEEADVPQAITELITSQATYTIMVASHAARVILKTMEQCDEDYDISDESAREIVHTIIQAAALEWSE